MMMLSKPDMTTLNNAVNEAVSSLSREEGEKVFRKDVAERMKEELGIKPATFNALVKERFNEAITNRAMKDQEIVELNEQLINNSRQPTTN